MLYIPINCIISSTLRTITVIGLTYDISSYALLQNSIILGLLLKLRPSYLLFSDRGYFVSSG